MERKVASIMAGRDGPRRWRGLSDKLIAAQIGAFVLIALFAIARWSGASAPGLFWTLIGLGMLAWVVVGLTVVWPLSVMASDVGTYAAGDVEAVRLAVADAEARQERLAREIHHRVKNNLQVISSLISIQARDAGDRDVARAYGAIQLRVGALALVHRWLIEDSHGQGVDLGALAHDLCGALQQGVGAADGVDLAIETRIERLYIAQDAAVPIAFLITEIVAAASGSAISLCIEQCEAGGRLSIASPGFAGKDRLAATAGSAQARIVGGMVRQLRATMRRDDTAYVIEFPLQ